MVHSLSMAAEWLKNDICLVTYGDLFFEAEPIKELIQIEDDFVVCYDPYWLNHWRKRFVDPLSDAETFKISKEGELVEIGKKAKTEKQIEGQYMGIVKISPDGWTEMLRTINSLSLEERLALDMTTCIQLMIERNRLKISTFAYNGDWGEIDSQSDLELYNTAKL